MVDKTTVDAKPVADKIDKVVPEHKNHTKTKDYSSPKYEEKWDEKWDDKYEEKWDDKREEKWDEKWERDEKWEDDKWDSRDGKRRGERGKKSRDRDKRDRDNDRNLKFRDRDRDKREDSYGRSVHRNDFIANSTPTPNSSVTSSDLGYGKIFIKKNFFVISKSGF